MFLLKMGWISQPLPPDGALPGVSAATDESTFVYGFAFQPQPGWQGVDIRSAVYGAGVTGVQGGQTLETCENSADSLAKANPADAAAYQRWVMVVGQKVAKDSGDWLARLNNCCCKSLARC